MYIKKNECLGLDNLGDEEARHGLAVTVLALVVLLAPVLEHDELLILEVLEHSSLHPGTLDVRHPKSGLVAIQRRQHALKRNLRARLHTLQAVALVVTPLGNELLRATHLDDGVPGRGSAGGGGGGETNLVDASLRGGCIIERDGEGGKKKG